MPTFQQQLLNEIAAGHDGPTIPPAKLAYFQERLRDRLFDFIVGRFLQEQQNGLNKAKLARRIGKKAEVINRWLAAPSNLTVDTISDLLVGIGAEEPEFSSSSLLGRARTNYLHLDDLPPAPTKAAGDNRGTRASALDDKKSEEDTASAAKMAYAE